jgi:putative peptide zinc metalloprotease protein
MCLIAGLVTAVARFQDLVAAAASPEFLFGPQNLGLMLAVFVCVKVLHEAGHAVTARLFGAECTECGVMLMVFTPVLYTNVTDTWRLPGRQRITVTAAGIMVELFLASVSLLLWTMASPGLTKNLLLNTVLICSVNTVLFNGNPLLRFDGYFILADWVGIPNLAARSGSLVKEAILSLLTGRSREAVTRDRSVFLLSYGILAATYRLSLTFAILQFILGITEQWRIEFAGAILAVIVVIGFLVIPLAAFVKELASEHCRKPFRPSAWGRLAGIAGGGLLLLLTPLPASITLPAFVIPDAAPVYAALPGRLEQMPQYGARIEEGIEVIRLSNDELTFRRSEIQARADLLKVDLRNLRSLEDPRSDAQIPGIKQALQAELSRLEEFDNETAELRIVSPRSGTLLPPPARSPQNRSDLPKLWSGVPGDTINIGAWIERGTLLGSVGEPQRVHLQIAVPESSVQLLTTDQKLTFFINGAEAECTGVITNVNPISSDILPPQFAVAGLVNGQVTDGSLVPVESTHLATAALDSTGVTPALYSAGEVRVQLPRSSLLDRAIRYLQQTF